MRLWPELPALFALLALTSCGKPLGEYEVSNVRLVPASAEPDQRWPKQTDEMLRVEFVSETDLYEASDGGGGGLYVFASGCPYDQDRTLYVGEAYYDDRSRYGEPQVESRKGRTETVSMKERHPKRNAVSGEYTYTTYLAVTRTAELARSGRDEQVAYNLRTRPMEICLRINHPGYFITPSRSRVFKIPALMFQYSLRNNSALR